jgi:hypothetical protein
MQQICEVGKLAAEFSVLNLNKEYHLEDIEVNKSIILKLILKRLSVKAYSGFLIFEIMYVTGTC